MARRLRASPRFRCSSPAGPRTIAPIRRRRGETAGGFSQIIWVGINAIWLYKLTEASGHSLTLRRVFDSVSDDLRIQVILIAFCFGSLLEGLAGGGSPVAICTVMLVALGVEPVKAAVVCLIADTTPVAFGALGLPINTLSKLTGLPVSSLSAMIGRQTPLLAAIVPFILLYILDGKRGIRQLWPFALTAGLSFGACQFLGSMTLFAELVDIVAAMATSGLCMGFLRWWAPAETTADPVESSRDRRVSRSELMYAVLPYLSVVMIVALAQVGAIRDLFSKTTSTFAWPGLSVTGPDGALVTAVTAKFEWLASPGSLILVAGTLVAPFLGLRLKTVIQTYGETLYSLRWAVVTVSAVVGLAYVMNLSGQIITLGIWAAGAEAPLPYLAIDRMVGHRRYRLRHFLQRSVWDVAGHDGASCGPVGNFARRRKYLGWGLR